MTLKELLAKYELTDVWAKLNDTRWNVDQDINQKIGEKPPISLLYALLAFKTPNPNIKLIEALLKEKAEIGFQEMFFAFQMGDPKIVRLFLEHMTNDHLSLHINNGHTLLSYYASSLHLKGKPAREVSTFSQFSLPLLEVSRFTTFPLKQDLQELPETLVVSSEFTEDQTPVRNSNAVFSLLMADIYRRLLADNGNDPKRITNEALLPFLDGSYFKFEGAENVVAWLMNFGRLQHAEMLKLQISTEKKEATEIESSPDVSSQDAAQDAASKSKTQKFDLLYNFDVFWRAQFRKECDNAHKPESESVKAGGSTSFRA